MNKHPGPKKVKVKDYLVTVYLVILLVVTGGYVLLHQYFWKLTYSAHKKSKTVKSKPLRDVAHLALNKVSKPLALSRARSANSSQQFNDRVSLGQDIFGKRSQEEDLAKEEKHLEIINGAQAVHSGVANLFLRLNPFWNRKLLFDVKPKELNKTTHIYMGNHTSYADFVFLAGMGLNLTAVGKSDLLDLPVGGKILRNAGLLPVHFRKVSEGKWTTDQEKTKKMLEDAIDYLYYGVSILVFPEGQIGSELEPERFKPGFIAVAEKANVDIVPFAIFGAEEVWPMAKKHVPRFPLSYGNVYIKFGRPVEVLDKMQISSVTSPDNFVLLLEQHFKIDFSNKLCVSGISDLIEGIIRKNDRNEIDEEFSRLVDDLTAHCVRKRVFELKCELMDLAQSENKKKKQN